MKLKKILLLMMSCLLGFSCSQLEDSVQHDAEQDLSTTAGHVYLSLALDSPGIETKSGTSAPAGTNHSIGQAVNACALFIFDASNQVVAYRDLTLTYQEATNMYTTNQAILVKYQENLKTFVVANSTASLAACASYEEVCAAIQSDELFDADNLVKTGTLQTVNWSGITPSASTVQTAENTVTVHHTVSQLTAAIRFNAFRVSFAEGSRINEVTVNSVTLKNSNTQSLTKGDLSVSDYAFKDFEETINKTAFQPATGAVNPFADEKPLFFSFRNADTAHAVEMTIHFTIGDKPYERSYVINRPTAADDFANNSNHAYVNAGYLYDLIVNLQITDVIVDFEVVCYTRDWNYNEITIPL